MTADQHAKIKKRNLASQKILYTNRKKSVLDHYGWACACCGETVVAFLCIDHVNGGGNKHREELTGRKNGGGATMKLYKWLIDNDFPPEFRTLCHNCNFVTRLGDPCPHEMEMR